MERTRAVTRRYGKTADTKGHSEKENGVSERVCVHVCVCPHLHYLSAELRDELLLVGIYDSHLDQSIGLPVSARGHQIIAGYRGGRMERREKEMKDTREHRRKRIRLTVNSYKRQQQVEVQDDGVLSLPSLLEPSSGDAANHWPHWHHARSYENVALAVNEGGTITGRELCMHEHYSSISYNRGGLSVSVAAKHRKCAHSQFL